MRALNARYRGKDRTTDVLSFPLATSSEGNEETEGEPQLGDVVVSVPQAARQARPGDAGPELLRLLVHGFCHLRGLDHEAGKAEARRMWLEEARLCEAIGVRPRPE